MQDFEVQAEYCTLSVNTHIVLLGLLFYVK